MGIKRNVRFTWTWCMWFMVCYIFKIDLRAKFNQTILIFEKKLDHDKRLIEWSHFVDLLHVLNKEWINKWIYTWFQMKWHRLKWDGESLLFFIVENLFDQQRGCVWFIQFIRVNIHRAQKDINFIIVNFQFLTNLIVYSNQSYNSKKWV